MKRIRITWLLTVLLVAVFSHSVPATVEWDIRRTLNLDAAPLDVAVTLNGKWIYVLTDKGTILAYAPDGRLMETIQIGTHIDQIRVGPREDILILKSTQNKTVQVLTLDFIRPINIAGSPFKGPADASVTIAVFSEFQ